MASDTIVEYDEAADDGSLSETQEKILSLSSQLPVALSVMGSSIIIAHVSSSKSIASSLPAPYRRILFMLSVCDILSSATLALQPFLNEQEWVWSVGNEATCTMLGTLQQFALSTVFYSGFLSLYFVMTVRWGWKQEEFGRKMEPWLHACILLFSTVTSITGAAMGFYGPLTLGPGCWIKDFPEGCYDDPTTPCNMAIGTIFGAIPVVAMLILLIVNNLLLYCYVRTTITKGLKYDVSRQIHASQREIAKDLTASDCAKTLGANPQSTTYKPPTLEASTQNDSTISSTPTIRFSTTRDNKMNRVRDVGIQSFLYVATFFLAYLWTFTVRFVEYAGNRNAQQLFPLLFIQSISLPSQGFFNVIVFLRPNYVKLRRKFPEEGRLWCVRRTLCGNSVSTRKECTSKSRSNRQESARDDAVEGQR